MRMYTFGANSLREITRFANGIAKAISSENGTDREAVRPHLIWKRDGRSRKKVIRALSGEMLAGVETEDTGKLEIETDDEIITPACSASIHH